VVSGLRQAALGPFVRVKYKMLCQSFLRGKEDLGEKGRQTPQHKINRTGSGWKD
jgi:hypothetical protein